MKVRAQSVFFELQTSLNPTNMIEYLLAEGYTVKGKCTSCGITTYAKNSQEVEIRRIGGSYAFRIKNQSRVWNKSLETLKTLLYNTQS